MQELVDLLENNKIKFEIDDYAGHESIIIKGKKYQIWIYKDNKGFVSDLQKIPYTWGRMGSTWMEQIIDDIEMVKGVKLKR